MPQLQIIHEADPRQKLLESIGDISGIEVFNNQILMAVYQRPRESKTKGGLYVPGVTVEEDKWQSKVGLLLKKGPSAFVDDGEWFAGQAFEEKHDWLIFRPSDGWNITINGVLCRMAEDVQIRGRTEDCDAVF